jgi:uncharacterized protein YecE (DUF72 family)
MAKDSFCRKKYIFLFTFFHKVTNKMNSLEKSTHVKYDQDCIFCSFAFRKRCTSFHGRSLGIKVLQLSPLFNDSKPELYSIRQMTVESSIQSHWVGKDRSKSMWS